MSIPKLDPATILQRSKYAVMRMHDGQPTRCAALYETLDAAEAYVSDMNKYANAYQVYEIDHETCDHETGDSDTDHELEIARESNDVLSDRNDELAKWLDAMEKVLRATYHFVLQGVTDADEGGFETGAEYRVVAAFMNGIAQGVGVDIW